MQKHLITEEELNLNRELKDRGVQVGDKVDETELIYRPIDNPVVGSKAETILATSNPSHYENNKLNVMDGKQVIRTFSGEIDGQNWKKYAESYADANGYELTAFHTGQQIRLQPEEAEKKRKIRRATKATTKKVTKKVTPKRHVQTRVRS